MQIVIDRGGAISYWPREPIQYARVTIKSVVGDDLPTAVEDVVVSNTTISTTLSANAAVGATSLSLTSTVGIHPGHYYRVGPGDSETSEWILVTDKTASTVTIGDPEGLRDAYTSGDTFSAPRITYDLSAAQCNTIGAFRAEWELVLGDLGGVNVTGGSASTVTVLDADAANIKTGTSIVVLTTSGLEELVVESTSSAGGTTTITVESWTSTPAASDTLYPLCSLSVRDTVYYVVQQILYPTLTPAKVLQYWPDIRDEQFQEQLGTMYQPQLDLAWDNLYRDVRKLGENLWNFVGEPSLWEQAHFAGFELLLAERGIAPKFEILDWQEYLRHKMERYSLELQGALKTATFNDRDEDNVRDADEKKTRIRVRISR